MVCYAMICSSLSDSLPCLDVSHALYLMISLHSETVCRIWKMHHGMLCLQHRHAILMPVQHEDLVCASCILLARAPPSAANLFPRVSIGHDPHRCRSMTGQKCMAPTKVQVDCGTYKANRIFINTKQYCLL